MLRVKAEYVLWAAASCAPASVSQGLARVVVQPKPGGGVWIFGIDGRYAAIFEDRTGACSERMAILPTKGLLAACKLDKKRPGKLLRLHDGRLQVDQGAPAVPLYIEPDADALAEAEASEAPASYPEALLDQVNGVFKTPQSRAFIDVLPDAFRRFDFEGRGLRADLSSDGKLIRVRASELPDFTGVTMCLEMVEEPAPAEELEDW